ncbi:uncharacterized protein LOC113856572 [Abrus precatorius]|uniref:Uncharacterized protein LOC113856572 n=1 Tax=Abrus precatorius TaxID=3816 RepID=A0A8B8KKA1_ABRPR|nr:uncharacterized protein LOC113856572 [Abrus precatorius]
MDYQSFGRAQRPKGAIIKQVLKAMLVLAVCAWLLYQIKHSRSNTENYRGQTKLDGAYGTVSLGRKGSSSGRDDEPYGANKDKAEEEFGHVNEKFRTREGKEVELEQESQSKVSSMNKHHGLSKRESGKVDIESWKSKSGLKGHGNEKNPTRPIMIDSKSNDIAKEVQQIRKNAKPYFSAKENDEDEDPMIREKEIMMQKNVVERSTNADMTEEIDELVQSFHDENGVPPDANETEIVFGQARVMNEENISNVSKGSWLRKSIQEVTYAEYNHVEVNSEVSENDETVGEEINTSDIKRNSEIGEGDS